MGPFGAPFAQLWAKMEKKKKKGCQFLDIPTIYHQLSTKNQKKTDKKTLDGRTDGRTDRQIDRQRQTDSQR